MPVPGNTIEHLLSRCGSRKRSESTRLPCHPKGHVPSEACSLQPSGGRGSPGVHLLSRCGSRSRSEVCHVILKVISPLKPVTCDPLRHLLSHCHSRSRSEVCAFHLILKVMYPLFLATLWLPLQSLWLKEEDQRPGAFEVILKIAYPRIETSSLRPSGYLPSRCGSRTRIREHAPSVKSPFSTCQPQKPRPNSIGPMGPVKVTGQRSLFNHSVMHDIKLEYDRAPINFFLE